MTYSLIERQDTFVASLLNEKMRLTEANRQLLTSKSSSLPQIDNSQQLKEVLTALDHSSGPSTDWFAAFRLL